MAIPFVRSVESIGLQASNGRGKKLRTADRNAGFGELITPPEEKNFQRVWSPVGTSESLATRRGGGAVVLRGGTMKWPLVSVALACLASVEPTHALWTGPSYNPFNPVIAGIPVYCTSYSRQPVAFVPNFHLPDVGRAQPGMPPTIELNPNVLARLSPKMQLFWYGHECAHHVLGPANSESNADCWSIKTMRDQGLLAPHELADLQAQILSSPGSIWGHLPGPERARLLAQCYAHP